MLLGVYSTRVRAQQRVAECASTPGFQDYPNGFIIDEYTIDKDEWTSGFAQPPDDWVENGWGTK